MSPASDFQARMVEGYFRRIDAILNDASDVDMTDENFLLLLRKVEEEVARRIECVEAMIPKVGTL